MVCPALGAANAPTEVQYYDVSIPALNAAEALNRLADQTGAMFLFSYDLAKEQQANAVRGRYSLMEALSKLLEGSGLSPGLSDKGAITITPSAKAGNKSNLYEGKSMKTILWDRTKSSRPISLFVAFATAVLGTSGASASDPELGQAAREGAASALLEEVFVTASKASRAQRSQSVPITMSAFGERQIEALKISDLLALDTSMPNVMFEQVSNKATVNFSIRGLGVNSSKISTAPSVGVFVNGVYLGINSGVQFDTFDLEAIEVLRGPQGTLFGRNVTGGAVLLRYNRPEAEPDLKMRARLETGPHYSLAAAGGGALTDTISGRMAVFYEDDRGYFKAPEIGKSNFPQSESYSIRPSLRFTPGDRTDITLFTEYGRVTGDGAPSIAPDYVGGTLATPGTGQRRGLTDTTLVDIPGETFLEWYGGTLEVRRDVNFGDDASITSVTGYRELENFSYSDFDATPLKVVDAKLFYDQHQVSQELRYNGTFGRAKLTVGGYYFYQNALTLTAFPLPNTAQGGDLTEDVYGIFSQVDYALTDALTLQIGGRYTYEKKNAKTAPAASMTPGVIVPGNFGVPGACQLLGRNDPVGCEWTFDQEASYSDFSPKITVQYQVAPTAQIYASAQRAFRSGGFNSNYNAPIAQTPFGPEKQRAFEIGFKSDLFDGRTRLNAAAFLTKIRDLQRDITIFDPELLVTFQDTTNTADATIDGFEVELVQELTPGLVATAHVGYTDARYNDVRFDLTGDGEVTGDDFRQRLPRVMPWSYGLGITADRSFGFGDITARVSYTYRDESYFPDYNYNRRDGADPASPAADLVDALITFEPAGSLFSFSLYGKNLLDERTLGNFTPIVYPTLKGCACYPNKGRIVGVEITRAF